MTSLANDFTGTITDASRDDCIIAVDQHPSLTALYRRWPSSADADDAPQEGTKVRFAIMRGSGRELIAVNVRPIKSA